MRIIKFRAWFKVNGKDNFEMRYNVGCFTTGNNYFPMQFTGLTDKNGKEIYEGDIVSWKFNSTNECLSIVEFKDCGFYPFITKQYEGRFENAVVIGNIYENPELLN